MSADLLNGSYVGVVDGLANRDYHGLMCEKYTSSSKLKSLLSKTALHYKYERENPSSPSDDMLRGSLLHCLLLEPDVFASEFLVMPPVDLRTKEGKAIKAEMLEKATKERLTLVTDKLYEDAKNMAASAFANDAARELLMGATCELSIFWQSPFGGMRARLDGLNGHRLIEVKSTRDASPIGFAKQAFSMHYDLSLAHYDYGCRAVLGENVVSEYYFICVESSAPYVSQVYRASDSWIESGRLKWADAVMRLEMAEKSRYSIGYVDPSLDRFPFLELPKWAVRDAASSSASEF